MDTHIPVRRITKPAEAEYRPASHHQGDHGRARRFHLSTGSAPDPREPQGPGLSRNHLPRAAVAANAGELDSVKGVEGETLYRHCRVKDHHHHLLCRRCGTAIELEAPALEDWALAMGKQHGFSELEHVVEVTGYCPDCTLARREEESQGGAAR